MSARTWKLVALIGAGVAWCDASPADDKGITGFVNKTFTDAKGKEVKYVVYVPREYDGKKTFPVILFLHGSGEKNPVPWGLGSYIKARGDLDFLCVFPHTRDEDGWEPGTRGDTVAIRALDEAMRHYKADRKRIYLTGFSSGGRGTWGLGAKYADRWAALVPVAADSKPEWAQKVKDIPTWAFHGADDQSFLTAAKGRQAVEYVRKLGGTPIYTEFPGVGHVPDPAYHNDELYAWLKKQTRKPTAADLVVGDWQLKQPSVGESVLHITETAGRLEVQESGNGNAKSTIASYKDGLLVIHWEAGENLRGYRVLNLNPARTQGSGRTVFVRFKDFLPGQPREIEGRKVRVVEDVTIERVAPK